MESLLKPVTLSPEHGDTSATRTPRRSVDVSPSLDSVLDEIRTGTENALYGASSAESEELFAKHVLSLVEGAGLPVLQVMHYRWFLRELARLWRTRQGRDLAFHLELCIRKWVSLGLEPRTLQFLVSEAHSRLKAVNLERSHPPITPIAEDSSTVRNPNLCKSVESVDSPPAQASAESVDVLSDAGPSATSASSADVLSGAKPSVQSVKSVDARSLQTAKGAKIAKGPDSDTRILEASSPGILPGDLSFPGSMAGPRPPADSAAEAQRHEEEGVTAKDAKTEPDSAAVTEQTAGSASSAVDRSGTEQSVESVKSVDAS